MNRYQMNTNMTMTTTRSTTPTTLSCPTTTTITSTSPMSWLSPQCVETVVAAASRRGVFFWAPSLAPPLTLPFYYLPPPSFYYRTNSQITITLQCPDDEKLGTQDVSVPWVPGCLYFITRWPRRNRAWDVFASQALGMLCFFFFAFFFSFTN